MTGGSLLLVLSLAFPLVLLLGALSRDLRQHLPRILPYAPVPALATALFASGATFALPDWPLRLTLELDAPGAILLGVAALLWIVAGVAAQGYLRGRSDAGRFSVWWLTTLVGSMGVFIAADLPSFYLLFSMVSLAAYGLVVFDDTPSTRRAGRVYVALAVLGEAFLLLAFVLLSTATADNSLMIRDVVGNLAQSPWRDLTIGLIILGFGIKMGLVPFHVWMPLAYTAAPIPAVAVMSGAAVKAGVIGMIRFLPFDSASSGWGTALVVVGLFSAFYGVAIGITQKNPKTVLAYSSVSQMGVIATVFGMGLSSGDRGVMLGGAFYAAHHILVKGGLFLAIGAAASVGSRRLWPVLLPAAIIALGIGGLPLTGGALAKLAVKDTLGYGLVGTLGALSAAGSTLLMLHFLTCLQAVPIEPKMVRPSSRSALSMVLSPVAPWLAIALAAILVPWVLYLSVLGGSVADALKPYALWSSIWPMLIGGALWSALQRWGNRLPLVPRGDILVFFGAVKPASARCSAAFEQADDYLRRWPVAGLSLLILAVAFGIATFALR
ncbi:proton-conducting transporter membrane subunit [Kaistia dalseonensis]|uniref:Formate hydrogenlyase subunit 3/multisubunit Na+/H+ antiporter MnhD subunit n=1 Tax=Kaistia dalseonensis TaxID=410840 RepID=A0ABU0HAC2_9HYPH|nr:proton-conducting transporter membrane subunit [Kaistia dalseonensis]MCX5495848.1 proton-conducting transporter membrane subunit [Kaistia dalseonensis]MDQ0438449.1 formate hydrogenlyase subunit 3/multisubunit Na+/H+ antiporter MnhD subunit [Kaistia dalseonensis]